MKDYIENSIPKHIAIIMDGNGRWANNKGLDRTKGHIEGAKNFERIVRYSKKINIKYLTLYAFSTENWKRPKYEVNALMNLFYKYLNKNMEVFKKENIKLVISGCRENLSQKLIKKINEVEKYLKNCDSIVINIAFNYGSRKEICDALSNIVKKNIEISEENISKNLYNSFIPDPDLLIRTGGEFRISNFLLWQIAYSEIYISEKFWPEFNEDDLDKAIVSYNTRERRFGGINNAK